MNRKPTKGQYVEILLRSQKTIFSIKDIVLLWGEKAGAAARVRLSSYVKNGKLIRVHRGIYAKDKNYDRFELATRIYTPSYISFETVLTRSGINFQYYGNIFAASYVTREIEADGQKISFIRMKDYVLSNTIGIKHANGIAIATKERAFLDRIYISKDYHFDHLDVLDWDKVFEILPIYRNRRMNKKVEEYFKYYKENKSADKEALAKCVEMLEKMDNRHIIDGLGEMLTEPQKDWARAKLRAETIFLLKAWLESEK